MHPYTAAEACLLKAKLQAISELLTQTPFDQHKKLQFDKVLENVTPPICDHGAEELYLLTKKMIRPGEIPEVYVRAYTEVLGLRHFTNQYLARESRRTKTIAAGFAPTFSSIKDILLALDSVCETSLEEFFRNAEQRLKPFPFLQLPAELRLQFYYYLIPNLPYILTSSRKYPKKDGSLPENLSVMRTNKQIYEEIDKHCFNQSVLVLKASRVTTSAATQHYFATDTEPDYADRYTGLRTSRVGRRITQLEVQILPTEESLQDARRSSWSMADKVSLRQICSVLPNLETILFSYPKVDIETMSRIEKLWKNINPRRKSSPIDHNRKVTLEWVRHQLWLNARSPPYILWDLTYYRESIADLTNVRSDIMSQEMFKESVKLSGNLTHAQSVTATKADAQRWTEARDAISRVLLSV